MYRFFSACFGTIFIVFGVLAIIQPARSLALFYLSLPEGAAERTIVEALMAVYGIRDIFIGFAIYAATWFGSNTALGWIVIAAAAVAVGDGAVCKVYAGSGEWTHWGYTPTVALVGYRLLLE